MGRSGGMIGRTGRLVNERTDTDTSRVDSAATCLMQVVNYAELQQSAQPQNLGTVIAGIIPR